MSSGIRVAVTLPCYNEGAAIADVVKSFRVALPHATIYVFDNNSTDDTAAKARAAGAVVRTERLQGKGHVVRRAFADIEADVIVMADGDGTYDASAAPAMIDLLLTENLDMVSGARVASDADKAYRTGHQFGNRLFNRVVAALFGDRFNDIFTGYRVFSRRFVKSFPALTTGFDIETEIVVHSLELNLPTREVPTRYGERPSGSHSKLRTLRDGVRIMLRIVELWRQIRPLMFFATLFVLLALLSTALAIPIITHYLETGLVPRLPTAVLATGIMILAFLSLACGILLDSVSYARREAKRLAYIGLPPNRTDAAERHVANLGG